MTPGLNLVISAHPGTLFGQVHITFLPLEPGCPTQSMWTEKVGKEEWFSKVKEQ